MEEINPNVRFAYDPPNPEKLEHIVRIRESAKVFASEIYCLCPGSREKSLAFTKLEEAVMWANAAIERND